MDDEEDISQTEANKINKKKDFFKPSCLEIIIGLVEIPFVSLPVGLVSYHLTEDYGQALAYSVIPQALTYLAGRAIEMGLIFKNKRGRFVDLKDAMGGIGDYLPLISKYKTKKI